MTNDSGRLNYVSLIDSTMKTLNDKKTLSSGFKQKALRFYHLINSMRDGLDDPTLIKLKEYERYLYERKVLI